MKRKIKIVTEPRVWVRGASTLADALGCTRSHMSMILHGTRKPGRKLAARMKEAGIAWPIAQGNGAKGGKA